YDLEGKRELWRVDAAVTSKVAVGGAFVTGVEKGSQLVARDVRTGKILWQNKIEGTFLGLAADPGNVYQVIEDKSDKQWHVVAYAGKTGDQLWRISSQSLLGAP